MKPNQIGLDQIKLDQKGDYQSETLYQGSCLTEQQTHKTVSISRSRNHFSVLGWFSFLIFLFKFQTIKLPGMKTESKIGRGK